MFKCVHLIKDICRTVYNFCIIVCNVFKCPEHSKKGDNDE